MRLLLNRAQGRTAAIPQPRGVGEGGRWCLGEGKELKSACMLSETFAHKIINLESPLKFCADVCIYVVFLM